MASSEGPSGSEFMDDFYAECDEHLGDVRSGLLTLESAIGKQAPDPAILNESFAIFIRSKASSGWRGCSWPKRWRIGPRLCPGTDAERSVFSDEGFGALTACDGTAGADRGRPSRKKPAPDIVEFAGPFWALLDESQEAGRRRPGIGRARAARGGSAGRAACRCGNAFSNHRRCSQEKSVTVNSARARAQELGEICTARRRSKRAGRISFRVYRRQILRRRWTRRAGKAKAYRFVGTCLLRPRRRARHRAEVATSGGICRSFARGARGPDAPR